jgi:electron-transferring-flavoprotein dehydrogenase
MPERDVLETDVLVVGGGPAGLATPSTSRTSSTPHKAAGKPIEASVMVVEKSAEFGAHSLSGAVLDPVSLRELIPDFEAKGAPSAPGSPRTDHFLTESGKIGLPIVPPPPEPATTSSASTSS